MSAIPARVALLAETSWLADHLDDPQPSIVDIRGSIIMPVGAPAPHYAAKRDAYAKAPVITYCNPGVSASVGLFALKLAGFPTVSTYAGSWYEWESEPGNPIEKG